MERRHTLRDDQWEKIKDAPPGNIGDRGRTASGNRLFIDAVIWIAKTGAPLRDLPGKYGKWATVHNRFIRWSKNGVWKMIFNISAVMLTLNGSWSTAQSFERINMQQVRGGGSNGRNLVDQEVDFQLKSTPPQTPSAVQLVLF